MYGGNLSLGVQHKRENMGEGVHVAFCGLRTSFSSTSNVTQQNNLKKTKQLSSSADLLVLN